MQIADVFSAYQSEMSQIEIHLDRYVSSDIKLIPEVAHHLIDSGGKRLRPLLHMICSRLCGYLGDHRFPLAASLEFIHTASLLHDDVIDEAFIRRGKTSANNLWGNAASVLVGDFLYSQALKLLSEIGDLAIIQLMSKTTHIMSEGEVFQLMKCGDASLTEAEYLSIVEKKTALLISAACASGAILGGASQDQITALEQYGYKIGMAFQITDDTLDYIAREEDFGKSIGKDLEEGKMTLPLIYTLTQSSEAERQRIKNIIGQKAFSPETTKGIFALIQKSGGIDYSLNQAKCFIREAKEGLDVFAPSAGKDHLLVVADYILSRKI